MPSGWVQFLFLENADVLFGSTRVKSFTSSAGFGLPERNFVANNFIVKTEPAAESNTFGSVHSSKISDVEASEKRTNLNPSNGVEPARVTHLLTYDYIRGRNLTLGKLAERYWPTAQEIFDVNSGLLEPADSNYKNVVAPYRMAIGTGSTDGSLNLANPTPWERMRESYYRLEQRFGEFLIEMGKDQSIGSGATATKTRSTSEACQNQVVFL